MIPSEQPESDPREPDAAEAAPANLGPREPAPSPPAPQNTGPPAGPPRPAAPQPTAEAPTSDAHAGENPYALPLEGGWADTSSDAPLGSYPRPPTPPWLGGWWVMLLVVGLLSAVGIAAAIQADHPAVGGLLIPLLGLAAIAVVVRLLHTTVDVHWPIYLLIAAGFGIVSYFAFIPVCFAVGLPSMFILEALLSNPAISGSVAVFVTVAVCGLLFTLLLRLYFRHRYRQQWFESGAVLPAAPREGAAGTPSASETRPGTDPFTIPRD